MISAGFQWGVKPKLHSKLAPPIPINTRKRRHDETSSQPASTTPRRVHAIKKPRTPRIIGQTLPVNRLVEVLDHHSLQNLVSELIKHHPEIAETVNKLSPKPSVNSSLLLIKEKFDQILSHLPYKCETESDYSYLRIKPYFVEFLNCLSDFILNYLPPIELNTLNSLGFLNAITSLLHDLPHFSNSEFQYTKNMAYEQTANMWFIIISGKISIDDDDIDGEVENGVRLMRVVGELDLFKSLEEHEEKTGKFGGVIEYLRGRESDVGNAEPVLGGLITVDYSNFSVH